MNKYDELFDFRMATEEDIDAVMQFIREEWDANHILGNSKEFFKYHYRNDDGSINVFLMLDKRENIVGMLGFVRYSIDYSPQYVTGSITKVKNDLPIPLCGVELIKRMHDNIFPYIEFACGANSKTILPIFDKIFKYHTGRMNQYYLLNLSMNDYRIITVPDAKRKNKELLGQMDKQYELVQLESIENTDFDFEKRYENLPHKDRNFVQKRYFQHPVFSYTTYAVKNLGNTEGLLFTRKIDYSARSIILVVDFIGEVECIGHLREALYNILEKENAECFNLLVGGFPQTVLERAGFCLLTEGQQDVIIPTYFEPFTNINIDNYYISSKEDLIIFKASGDQDNPKYLN